MKRHRAAAAIIVSADMRSRFDGGAESCSRSLVGSRARYCEADAISPMQVVVLVTVVQDGAVIIE